jgi:AcrR family transcriptional regulator
MSIARRLAPEARRAQLVDHALELFASGGHQDVGLDDVARAAEVRRSLLYRYFPGGKPDLYLAVVEEAWRRLVDRIDTDRGRPVEEKLPANVATFLDLAEAGDAAVRVLAQATRVDEPRVRAVTREARRTWARRIAQNHLGVGDPAEPVLAALAGYLALAQVLMEEWLLHSTVGRAEIEAVLEGALPPIVAIARAL